MGVHFATNRVIPDIIPVLGYLDEVILLPFGILGSVLSDTKSCIGRMSNDSLPNSQKVAEKLGCGDCTPSPSLWISLATSILFKLVI
jgi:hypothetical protein